MILFIPAAFSFVCPTEVLAFHNCIDEFAERDCEVVFVSTDSKHCLWQWQHLPKSLGGLGGVRVTLASDQSHQMSRDYGVLLENKGMATRGMYIIDPEGIVQQITMNNIAVGRSVLEALRLVEAFKVAADKGVLCPANWKVGEETLAETYEDQEHDLIRQMAGVQIKNLDNNTSEPFQLVMPKHIEAKHKHTASAPNVESPTQATQRSRAVTQSSTANNSKRNSAGHTTNNRVTLEFSDPLAQPKGSKGTSNEFVTMAEEGKHSGSTSPTTGMQKGIEALKKMSSGWSTPLRSPGLSGPSPIKEVKEESLTSTPGSRSGYFD